MEGQADPGNPFNRGSRLRNRGRKRARRRKREFQRGMIWALLIPDWNYLCPLPSVSFFLSPPVRLPTIWNSIRKSREWQQRHFPLQNLLEMEKLTVIIFIRLRRQGNTYCISSANCLSVTYVVLSHRLFIQLDRSAVSYLSSYHTHTGPEIITSHGLREIGWLIYVLLPAIGDQNAN